MSYLKVSVSGYYKHLNSQNLITTQKTENAQIEEYIIHTQEKKFRKSKSRYKRIGYRQMTLLLNASGEFENAINHKRVYRIMKKISILSTFRQKNPYRGIPGVTQEHQTYENLVDGNFDTPYLYNVLCTDITYLICDGIKAYLSVIKDATDWKNNFL